MIKTWETREVWKDGIDIDVPAPSTKYRDDAIEALRQALAQPEQRLDGSVQQRARTLLSALSDAESYDAELALVMAFADALAQLESERFMEAQPDGSVIEVQPESELSDRGALVTELRSAFIDITLHATKANKIADMLEADAQEIARLHSVYEKAVQGRADFRGALRAQQVAEPPLFVNLEWIGEQVCVHVFHRREDKTPLNVHSSTHEVPHNPVAWLHPDGSCATTDSWYGVRPDEKWTPLFSLNPANQEAMITHDLHKKAIWKAASLLVSAATVGMTPFYEDGTATPNSGLCLDSAAFLHQFLCKEPFDEVWRVQLEHRKDELAAPQPAYVPLTDDSKSDLYAQQAYHWVLSKENE